MKNSNLKFLLFTSYCVAFFTLNSSLGVAKVSETPLLGAIAESGEEEGKKGESGKKKKKKVRKKKFYLWASSNYSKTRDSFFLSQSKTKSYPAYTGFDYRITQDLKGALFYSNTYSKSRGRATAFTSLSRDKSDTHNIFGTLAYYFQPHLFLNVAVGYAHIPNRNVTFTGRRLNRVTFTKTKTNIFSLSPSLNYTIELDNFLSAFQFGYSHTDSWRRSTVNSRGRFLPKKSFHLDAISFFADFCYKFHNIIPYVDSVAPYAQGGINHNYQGPQLIARDGNPYYRSQDSWKAGSGLRFFISESSFLNAGWQVTIGRTGLVNNTVSLTLRTGLF